MNKVSRQWMHSLAPVCGIAAFAAAIVLFGGCGTSQPRTGVQPERTDVEEVTATQQRPSDESIKDENGDAESGPFEDEVDGVRQITLHIAGMSERLNLF